MITRGFGRGYETTSFEDARSDGLQRIAAFVFWRGGGFVPEESFDADGIGIGYQRRWEDSSFRGRLVSPLRRLGLAMLLGVVRLGLAIREYRDRRRRKPFTFVPMSVAVQEARQWARYQAGTLQINARKFAVPEHSTLVVFVEDDPSQDDDLAISTHLLPIEAHVSGAGAPDGVHIRFMRGPARMRLAIQEDPVCQEFIRRVGQ